MRQAAQSKEEGWIGEGGGWRWALQPECKQYDGAVSSQEGHYGPRLPRDQRRKERA